MVGGSWNIQTILRTLCFRSSGAFSVGLAVAVRRPAQISAATTTSAGRSSSLTGSPSGTRSPRCPGRRPGSGLADRLVVFRVERLADRVQRDQAVVGSDLEQLL